MLPNELLQNELLQDGSVWAWAGGTLAGAVVLGLVVHYLLYRGLTSLIARVPSVGIFQGALLRYSRRPARLLFPLLSVLVFLPLIAEGLPEETAEHARAVLYPLIVFTFGWLAVRSSLALESYVSRRFDVEAENNLEARKVVTQTRILRRIFVVVVVLLCVALVLMRYFPSLGAGILASAGVAGIAVGFAAQKTLGNLFAGFQLAITQPIRVDDVVIVEGEFGWVEEITLTYVVVRVWDLRRIVLPISYFMDKPFQNWTRTSANLLGTVFLYVDYTVPVEDVREEHRRFVEGSDLWDGNACAVQVTDASERTVEIRCLQSAASAPVLFQLRCAVREHMIGFVQERHPGALPKVRAEMGAPLRLEESPADGAAGDGAKPAAPTPDQA